jgi:hypothetical protein
MIAKGQNMHLQASSPMLIVGSEVDLAFFGNFLWSISETIFLNAARGLAQPTCLKTGCLQ